MLGHKTNLNKFKMTEIIPSIFSDHSALKLEINCKKKVQKPTNMWKLNNMLLKIDWVKEKIKGEIKRYIEINENDDTPYQNFWDSVRQ